MKAIVNSEQYYAALDFLSTTKLKGWKDWGYEELRLKLNDFIKEIAANADMGYTATGGVFVLATDTTSDGDVVVEILLDPVRATKSEKKSDSILWTDLIKRVDKEVEIQFE